MEDNKERKRMTVSRDVNLGTLLPIMALLLPMSLTAIWWAGTTTARFEAVVERLSDTDADTALKIAAETNNRIDDRRRIYDRLVEVEQSVAAMTASAGAQEVAMNLSLIHI